METSGNSFWTPYKIPATPNISSKNWALASSPDDPYVISAKSGSLSSKNPTINLEWDKVPVNFIKKKLDEHTEKLDEHSTKLEEHTNKLNEIDAKILSLQDSIFSLESAIGSLQVTVNGLSASIAAILDRYKEFDVCENGQAKNYKLLYVN